MLPPTLADRLDALQSRFPRLHPQDLLPARVRANSSPALNQRSVAEQILNQLHLVVPGLLGLNPATPGFGISRAGHGCRSEGWRLGFGSWGILK